MFENKLANMETEKFLIPIDTAAHNFEYTPDKINLNKFDVFITINVSPINLLLSQKIYAIFNRNRPKGRDFFDLIFLLGKNLKPNYIYLQAKIGIASSRMLKEKLIAKCKTLDFTQLYEDVRPFLFNPNDRRVKKFLEYIKSVEF